MTGGLYNPRPVDDVPVNGQLTHGVTSNRMFDHEADLDAHIRSYLEVIRTGEYFLSPAGEASNYPLTANTLYGRLLVIPRDMRVDRIAVNVKTAVDPSDIRLGIYNVGTNLYPGTLLLDAGTVDSATTGVKAIIINQALTKGIYFCAIVSDDVPDIYSSNRANIGQCTLGLDVANLARPQAGWSVAFGYAALPDPFTAGGASSYLHGFTIPVRIASLD